MNLLEVRPVVLVTGISAAGKSTVAEMLARRFERGVHVRGDVFRRMVVAGRHEMTAAPTPEALQQLAARYRLGALVADRYHREGFAVVVQDIVIGAGLDQYAAAIESRPLVVVVLAPRPEAVAARERQRDKVAYREGMHGVAELDRALRDETPRIGLWLDTSDQQPEETVEDIVRRGLDDGLIE